MRTVILSIILLALATLVGRGQSAPQFEWGAVVRSNDLSSASGINVAYDIKAGPGGDVFIFGTFMSHATSAFKSIAYKHYDAEGTQTVVQSPNGALTTTSVSGNSNLFLYKLNAQGELLWQVTSNRGYIDGHYSQFTPTPDGGALLALTACFAGRNEFEDNRLVRIVNTNGSSTSAGSVTRPTYVNNTDQGVLVKIAPDGTAQWTRHFIRVDESLIDGNLANTALYINDLTLDASGNIWLAGRYLKAITLDRPDGTPVTLTPHNIAGWDGDAQETRGDALLLKLNSDGQYLWHLETTGIVDYQSAYGLHIAGNDLFLYGNIAGTPDDPTSQSSFLGHTLAPSDKTNAYSARLDISGSQPQARWVTLLKSLPQTNGKGGRIKITNLEFDSGALFLCGSLTGFIQVNGQNILANDAITGETSNYLLGFFIRQDPETGAIVGAYLDPSAGLAAEIENVAFRQNKYYAFGYALGSSWLHVYSDDFQPVAQYNLLSSGGATAWDAVFFDDRFITINRGRQMNAIGGTIAGGAPQALIADDPEAYSAYFLAYNLDGLQRETGIRNPGQERVTIDANTPVRLFAIDGQLRYAGPAGGIDRQPLPAGVYLLSAGGTAKKIIIGRH
jgi:hypothetical protein